MIISLIFRPTRSDSPVKLDRQGHPSLKLGQGHRDIYDLFIFRRKVMKKYIKSITALNDATLSNKNTDDIERCAEADIFWAKKQKQTFT